MTEIENPFALPVELEENPTPDKPVAEISPYRAALQAAIAKVEGVAWDDPNTRDGAASYTQNRMTLAEATTDIGNLCDLEDAESVRACIGAYFEMCKLNSTNPSLPGLANALGKSTKWIKDLRSGGNAGFYNIRPLPIEVKEEVDRALRMLDQLFAQMVMDGMISPAAAQQIGTNHYDYTNKVEHSVDLTSRGEQIKTLEEIAKEFERLPPIENAEFREVKDDM